MIRFVSSHLHRAASMFTRSTWVLQLSRREIYKASVRTITTKRALKMTQKDMSSASAKAHDFIDFVNDSPTRK